MGRFVRSLKSELSTALCTWLHSAIVSEQRDGAARTGRTFHSVHARLVRLGCSRTNARPTRGAARLLSADTARAGRSLAEPRRTLRRATSIRLKVHNNRWRQCAHTRAEGYAHVEIESYCPFSVGGAPRVKRNAVRPPRRTPTAFLAVRSRFGSNPRRSPPSRLHIWHENHRFSRSLSAECGRFYLDSDQRK